MSEEQVTFKEFADAWLRDWSATRTKSTGRDEYAGILDNHLIPAIGDRCLGDLSTADLQRYVSDKVAEGYSPRTVSNHVRLLRRMFKSAVKQSVMKSNPALDVELPKSASAEVDFLLPEEIQRCIEAASPSWRLLIALPCLSGARKGEVLGLKWDCVSIDAGTITFKRSLRKGVLHEVKTAASKATVPMAESLISLFEARKAKVPDPIRGFVFCTKEGSPLSDARPNKVLAAALARAGLKKVRFHDLRHSWVAAHIAAGTPVKAIQELGRWRSAQTLLDVYSHLLASTRKEAVDGLDELVSKSE